MRQSSDRRNTHITEHIFHRASCNEPLGECYSVGRRVQGGNQCPPNCVDVYLVSTSRAIMFIFLFWSHLFSFCEPIRDIHVYQLLTGYNLSCNVLLPLYHARMYILVARAREGSITHIGDIHISDTIFDIISLSDTIIPTMDILVYS